MTSKTNATGSSEQKNTRKGVQSIDMSGVLMEALCRFKSPMPLKDIAAACNIQPAKAHRYLTSLVRIGIAVQDEKSSHYDLGPLALRLGLAALSRDDVVKRATAALKELTRETLTTGHISIWSELGPVIITVDHGGTPIITSLGLGTTPPLLRSATGHIFLSYMNRASTARILAEEQKNFGDTEEQIVQLIDKTKSRGWSSIGGSFIPGLTAISGPVLNHDGSPACAITLISNNPQDLQVDTPMHQSFLSHLQKINNWDN